MKKLLLIALAAIVIASCKKSSTKPVQASIVGKWYATVDTARLYVNGVVESTQATNHNRSEIIQFNSDGTGTATGDGDDSNFTYSISGSTLTINNPAETSGGVTSPAETSKATINILTSNALVLYISESETGSGGEAEKATDTEYFSK